MPAYRFVIVEQYWDEVLHVFDTEAEADAFSKGVYLGASRYGAGSCAALSIDKCENWGLEPHPEKTLAAMREAIKKHQATLER